MIQGDAGAEVIQRQHRVGFATTKVGLQLDDWFAALFVEALQSNAQQIFQSVGDVSAPVELHRIGVFPAADATQHLIEICSELSLLVFALDHVSVRRDHLSPGFEVRCDLVLQVGLIARAVAGTFGIHLLL